MEPLSMAILGGMSLAKMVYDQKRERDSKRIAAAESRFSPWTGVRPSQVQYANHAGTLAGAVASGLAMNASAADAAQKSKLMDAQTNYITAMTPKALPQAAQAALATPAPPQINPAVQAVQSAFPNSNPTLMPESAWERMYSRSGKLLGNG